MALEVVSQLLSLSREVENRPFIVRNEGCLPGLVMFLENDNPEVVRAAVETMHNLASYEPNREIMIKEPGLVDGLHKLNPSDIPLLSSTLLDLEPKFTQTNSEQTFSQAPPVVNKLASAKTHTFYIKGMNNLTKHKVEETLVGVKGVVSFLIDIHTHKAVVRTMTSPDAVISAIRAAGLSATYGEGDATGKEEDEPDYLPEGQRTARKAWGWGSVISMGAKKQDPQQAEPQGQWGWGSVVKAIWG